jgi:hypothetical protein
MVSNQLRRPPRPQQWRSRVIILVPDRCAPAMQIAVWVSVLSFTHRPYTTIGCAVRQADYSTSATTLASGDKSSVLRLFSISDCKNLRRTNPSYI